MENNRASYLKKEENGTSIVFSASRIFTLCSVLILALVLVGKLMREREREIDSIIIQECTGLNKKKHNCVLV